MSNKFEEIYESIPKTLTALKRSQKVQYRTDEAIDFLYNEMKDIFQDVQDEIQELREEVKIGDKERIKQELGDVIFAMCRIGNKFDIDVEDALIYSNNEFERRFKHVGKRLNEMNVDKKEADKEILAELWNEAKSNK